MTHIVEHDLGITWVMDEPMERGSHALVDDGRVWLVDPVDDAQALERVAELGAPAGVIQLLDRHNRDCVALARRLGVPHLKVPDAQPDGAPFTVLRVIRNRFWREVALWWPERRALVVAEVLGTAPAFALGDGDVGIHPMVRMTPPGGLRGLDPELLLVGHGPPVSGASVPGDVERAIAHSRRDAPKLVLKLPSLIRDARR
ncbi:hypothetical protein [Baekduia sp. Peel2402]|uniref:hypothetical protein n=1 Tax=Baekduia sp. Peel2402 TaxID=3458296 RepID=UPI00403EBB5F